MKLKFALIVIIVLILFFGIKIYNNITKISPSTKTSIKYVAIGDSYTIGLGVEEGDRWPNVMTKHLKEKGIDIELVSNPAVSGFTVRDAIAIELPIIAVAKPDFVTILIGANDNFMERSVEEYRRDFIELLDKLQPMLKNPKNIVLVTIPDYSKSPAVAESEEVLSEFIDSYNDVIKDEGQRRNLPVADIFSISQTMTGEEDYVSDGLHPSAQGYEKWEKVILPVVVELLTR